MHHRPRRGLPGQDRGHDARVQATGQEHPHRYVGHRPLAAGDHQRLTHGGPGLLRRAEVGADGLVGPQGVLAQVDVGDQPALGGPDVPGRELLDVGTHRRRERVELGGGQDAVVVARPAERLDAQRVTPQPDLAVLVGHAERPHAPHVVDAVHTVGGQDVQHVLPHRRALVEPPGRGRVGEVQDCRDAAHAGRSGFPPVVPAAA